MAGTTAQVVVDSNGVFTETVNASPSFSFADLAEDVDVVVLWAEVLGIPFDKFASTSTPPPDHPWTQEMNRLVEQIKMPGKPIMLQLAFSRTGMVGKAEALNGKLVVNPNWAPTCLDFTSQEGQRLKQSFLNYIQWMVERFRPKYVVAPIEINLYHAGCGGSTPSWEALVDIERDMYDKIKSMDSSIVVFPSFSLDVLYNKTMNGWSEANYQALSRFKRDRFGISVYPAGLRPDGEEHKNTTISPYDLPIDYLLRFLFKAPQEKQPVITETGWGSTGISTGNPSECLQNFPYSSESFTSAYLSLLFLSAQLGGFELVTWFSIRDFLPDSVVSSCYVEAHSPYLACGQDPWCITINSGKNLGVGTDQWNPLFFEMVYKSFGSMGIRHWNGTEKADVYPTWKETLKKAYEVPRQRGSSDLVIKKHKCNRKVIEGKTLTCVVRIANAGKKTAKGSFFMKTLPPGIKLVKAPYCTPIGKTLVLCGLGNLQQGKSVEIRMRLRASQPGTFELLGMAKSKSLDPKGTNNVSSAQIQVKAKRNSSRN